MGTEEGLRLFYPDIPQTNFSKIPGSPIAYWVSDSVVTLFELETFGATCSKITKGGYGNNAKYFCFGMSQVEVQPCWRKYNKAGSSRKWFGVRRHVIDWMNSGIELMNDPRAGFGK